MLRPYPINSDLSRSRSTLLIKNYYSTNKNFFSPNIQSTFSLLDNSKDSSFKTQFRQCLLNQVNIKLDERVYDLITKMDDPKAYKEAKERYDEAKQILIKEILKDKYFDGFKTKNLNVLNIKNYIDKINGGKYSFDEKDNQLMFSLFDKFKTRKKKVFKFKIKNHLENLFQGNVALYKKRKEKYLEEQKKPEEKFDLKFLLKSNPYKYIEEFLQRKKEKKLMSEQSDKNNNELEKNNDIKRINENDKKQYKRKSEKKKTVLEKKSISVKEFFSNIIEGNKNRRKSFVETFTGFNSSSLLSKDNNKENKEYKDSKEENSSSNLPNINGIESQFISSRNTSKKSLQKKQNTIKDKKYDINSFKEKLDSKKSNNIIMKENTNDIKNDDNPIETFKTKNEKKDSKETKETRRNIRDIIHSKNITIKNILIKNNNQNKYTKININSKNNNTKKNKTRNSTVCGKLKRKTYISDTANVFLSELNDKEKELSMNTLKMNTTLKCFKKTKSDFTKFMKSNSGYYNYLKEYSEKNTLETNKNIIIGSKEKNSQFSFPIINKMFQIKIILNKITKIKKIIIWH